MGLSPFSGFILLTYYQPFSVSRGFYVFFSESLVGLLPCSADNPSLLLRVGFFCRVGNHQY